jgi:NAD(P)-binding Rossmann-like domain
MAERVVFGSSVASLVAAERLAAAGHAVSLFAPEKSIGGGFGSIRAGERVLELGVRLLELTYEGAGDAPSLSNYVPGPVGHRPFAAIVGAYLSELAGDRLREVQRPQMFFAGQTVDDLYFTTDVTALRSVLDPRTRAVVHAEALAAVAASGYDAGVLAPELAGEFESLGLTAASLANHGATFHRLFMQPVAQKFAGPTDVLAALRRKIWLPLFWPATLAEATGDGSIRFAPQRPFHTVAGGGSGEIITALRQRLTERGVPVRPCAPLRRLAGDAAGRTTLELCDGTAIEAVRPIIGISAAALFGAAGIEYRPEPARTVLSWLEVADDEVVALPSLLNVVDTDIPAVRVSSNGLGRPGHTVLTVELRHDLAESDIDEAARRSVERLGIVQPGAGLINVRSGAMPTFALPTRDNVARFDAAAGQFAMHPFDIEVVGAGLGFGADALGEQIIQGLRAAEGLTV